MAPLEERELDSLPAASGGPREGKRRRAAVTALAAMAALVLGGGVVLATRPAGQRGTPPAARDTAPRPTTSPAPARPAAPSPPAPAPAGNPAPPPYFPAFWPVPTLDQARELQRQVDAGHQPWRLDPAEVAAAFARDFMDWRIQIASTSVDGSAAGGWTAKVTFNPYIGEEGNTAPGRFNRHALELIGLQGAEHPAWFVAGLGSVNIVIDRPKPGDTISSPVRVAGRGEAYEGTVLASLRDDAKNVLHPRPGRQEGVLQAGATEPGPFSGSLPFTAPATPAGILVLMGDGGAGPVPDATIVRLRFASGGPQPQAGTRPLKVFLISLGDEGRSGPAVGCGDSVVAVERSAGPANAPLTAALTELLSLHDRTYVDGGRELYNGLWQARLRLDGVAIVDGKARIKLSGTPTRDGVCDDPRIVAQIVQTARQFPSVRSVSVTLNGVPLQKALAAPTTVPPPPPVAAGGWRGIANAGMIGRAGVRAVWTGNEMIVWGGTGFYGPPGMAYEPGVNRWRGIPDLVPQQQGDITKGWWIDFAPVWTGRQMIVWGGARGRDATPTDEGAALDPTTDTWTPLPAAPLSPRARLAAAWTGSEMLVWGGSARGASLADGASYDPATRSWRRIAPAPIGGRREHAWVWTGREMIVWGGRDGDVVRRDGAAYDPARTSWRKLADLPDTFDRFAPTQPSAVWTGKEMIVWDSESGGEASAGAAYDPARDTWRPIGASQLSDRRGAAVVWTGTAMLVFGGQPDPAPPAEFPGPPSDGAAYDPVADRWLMLPDSGLKARGDLAIVWTGREAIVWGGRFEAGASSVVWGDGAAFRPE